jgi:hypothetical protein
MIKLIAIAVAATALAACSNMSNRAPSGSSSMGASSGTMNSTDSQAQKSGNGAAVSPGGSAGGASK